MKENPEEHPYDNNDNRNEMVPAENEPMDHFDGYIEEECVALSPHIVDRKRYQTVFTSFPDQQEIPNSQLVLEPQPAEYVYQQKIRFAAVLNLMPKNATLISCEPLSKIELSYIGKCKAMVDMHQTFICACHNVPHRNLTGLLSHLRSLRIWFPPLSCYNCMITFTSRSTYTRHIERCPSDSLDTITKLSNSRERSEVKTRLYQNFKCTSCKIVFSFHEDFRRHVDDKHSPIKFPSHCQCCRIFDNIEDFEDHVYTSCLVNYHCDLCSTTTRTRDDFQRHARNNHDNSEGFILLQDVDHGMRKQLKHTKEVKDCSIPTEKREEISSVRAFITGTVAYKNRVSNNSVLSSPKVNNKKCPICSKEFSTYGNMKRHYKVHHMSRPLLHKEEVENSKILTEKGEDGASVRTNNIAYNNTVTIKPVLLSSKFKNRKCPICSKEFSTYNNMMRHYKVHLEKLKVAKAKEEEVLYSCPDCRGMYNSAEWQNHMTEKHESHIFGECGKSFQFQTELKQHNNLHLEVCRDVKKQSYKSIAVSPGYGDISKLSHENSSSDASAESSTSTDAEMSKYQLRKEEFVTYSDLSNHKIGHLDRKKPLRRSFPKPNNYCENKCRTGAANHKPQENTTDITEIGKKYKSSAEEQSDHICKMCFKVFFSKSNLKNHMKCHGLDNTSIPTKTVRVPNSNICQQVFNTTNEVDEHKEVLHYDKNMFISTKETETAVQFTCDFCVITFTSKMDLNNHKEKHIEEAYASKQAHISCKYCEIPPNSIVSSTRYKHEEHGKSGKSKIDGMKPAAKHFLCTVCEKNFLTAGALASHFGWHKRGEHKSNAKLIRQNKVRSAQMRQTSIEELVRLGKF